MDEEPLELELSTSFEGIDDAKEYAEALRKVADAQDRARQSASEATRQMQALDSARAKGSRQAHGYATALTDGAFVGEASCRFPSGPAQRLDKAKKDQMSVRLQGESDLVTQDVDYRARKAQEAYDRAFKPDQSVADKIAQAISTSRFGVGGASPLVGRSLAAMGVQSPTGQVSGLLSKQFPSLAAPASSGAGAMVGVAGAAVFALKMLADAAEAGARRIRQYADASARPSQEIAGIREVSGGSLSESAQLRGFGVSGERARQLTDRIATDPFAKAAAGRMGVQALPGPYGTLDTARATIKTIEGLRRIRSEEEALRMARVLQAEDLLKFRRVSESTFKAMRRDAELTGRINDAPQVLRSAEYEASLSRLQQAQENAKAALSAPVLEGLADLFNGISTIVNGFAAFVKQNQSVVEGLGRFAEGAAAGIASAVPGGGLLVGAVSALRGAGEAGRRKDREQESRASPQVEALNANTEALHRLNRNLGGGARSRAALPEALTDGRNLARAINSGHLALGPL